MPPARSSLDRALKKNVVLTSLNLCENELDAETGKALASALEINAVVKKLNLDGHELNIEQLKGTDPAKVIDLSNKRLGIASGIVIAKCIEFNAVLTECSVRGNNLDNESANALAKVATEKRVMLFGIKQDQTEAAFSSQGLGPVDAVLVASDLRVSAPC